MEEVERKYSVCRYRESYEYDGFEIEDQLITLKGRYSRQGDWGSTEYTLDLNEFFHGDEYVKAREKKHQKRDEEKRLKEAQRKEEADKLQQEQEYAVFLHLKKKYEK